MEAGPCPVPRPGPRFAEPSCRAQLFLILFLSASLVSHLLSTLFPAQGSGGGGELSINSEIVSTIQGSPECPGPPHTHECHLLKCP